MLCDEPRIGAGTSRQCLRDLRVYTSRAALLLGFVGSVAHQCVDEPAAGGERATVALLEDAGTTERVEAVRQLLARSTGHGLQEVDVDVAPDD